MSPGLMCSSFMYCIAQLLLSEGMVNFAPQSGAEYLVSQAGQLADPMADWAAAAAASAAITLLEPNYLHDLMRSAMNAAVEIFDELQRPALMHITFQPGVKPIQPGVKPPLPGVKTVIPPLPKQSRWPPAWPTGGHWSPAAPTPLRPQRSKPAAGV